MPRVVGTDPGTSSLDLLLLDDGTVAGEAHLTTENLQADPGLIASTLAGWGRIDLIAAPSGYGVPLLRQESIGEREIELMTLTRGDESGTASGVIGFRSSLRAFLASGHRCVFLPGGVHLPSVPAHRKVNTVDVGTPDKIAVAALALRHHADVSHRSPIHASFAVVEVGSAFTAALVVEKGKVVDAVGGTRGPIGPKSGGAWDGEAAYWLSPLAKNDLFRGGVADLGDLGPAAFAESLVRTIAGMQAVNPFDTIYLSGVNAAMASGLLDRFAKVLPLPSLPGATVKHAAQGSALLANGLVGGRHSDLVGSLGLRLASGTALDGLAYRR